MSTVVHRSPNKLWRSNSIFNLCFQSKDLLRRDAHYWRPNSKVLLESSLVQALCYSWRPWCFCCWPCCCLHSCPLLASHRVLAVDCVPDLAGFPAVAVQASLQLQETLLMGASSLLLGSLLLLASLLLLLLGSWQLLAPLLFLVTTLVSQRLNPKKNMVYGSLCHSWI